MGKKSGETPDHLLLQCDAAKELGIMVFQLFGVEWAMPIDGWWIFRRVAKEGSAKIISILFGMQFLPF